MQVANICLSAEKPAEGLLPPLVPLWPFVIMAIKSETSHLKVKSQAIVTAVVAKALESHL